MEIKPKTQAYAFLFQSPFFTKYLIWIENRTLMLVILGGSPLLPEFPQRLLILSTTLVQLDLQLALDLRLFLLRTLEDLFILSFLPYPVDLLFRFTPLLQLKSTRNQFISYAVYMKLT
jgi:hypothetical protein